MPTFRQPRLSKAAGALAPTLLAALLGLGSFMFAHDDESLPHHGNPPLHAQDTMRAFLDDHHDPESLAAMSITSCVDGDAGGYPCSNVDLMAFLPLNQIGGGSGNDIWGWTDPLNGDEYALMGRSNGTSFVKITDPLNPVYLGDLPPHASNSSWRDIKVYDNHAFMVSEANQSGMQVFDLTQLRNVAAPPVTFSETAWYSGFLTAHNLVINEASGYAYAVGTNDCGGGLHMIDVQDPANPVFAGCFSADGYTHDAQCVTYQGPDVAHQGKEICFNSNEDTLTIVDVAVKSAPAQLSRTGYAGRRYTHQGWLTEDHTHFLLDDELDERDDPAITNTRTYIWDVSDLDNPVNIGFHDSTAGAIDHNQYVKGSHVYQANYRAGLRILDISGIAAADVDEVAYFDIYPASNSTGFNGAWSNYPFFDSGIVVVSGIEQGLFILKPTFGPTSDPPSVTLVNPAENDTVAGAVTVQIDAADDDDPAGSLTVEWNVDGGGWQPATFNAANGRYEATWDTTAASNGSKTVSARAIDSTSRSGSDSNNVTVFNSLPTFHVSSVQVTAVHVNGPRYRGQAIVAVVDEDGLPLGGVAVDGAFSGDWNGGLSATTAGDGQAAFETPPVKNGGDWTFCVDNASADGWTYDSAANVETCDSTGGSASVGSISGTITDSSTTSPIQGADVSTDTGQNAATDASGDYTLNSVPVGSRSVTAAANGYSPQQQQTTVAEETTAVLDFALDPSASGGSGSIKGTVTDGAGGKLGGVLIETDTGHSAVSNKGGKYTIQSVPEGVRVVTASVAGYLPEQQDVNVAAGQTATADFSLAPQ